MSTDTLKMMDPLKEGCTLVRVQALVMARDDSTGGWVPMAGGGLSIVSVRKCTVPSGVGQVEYQYFIFGKRISDQLVVLSCSIKKDIEYYKAMPVFHHWKSDDKTFGLSFLTEADGRIFNKGLRTALDELMDGASSKILDLSSQDSETDDDDVFTGLNFPDDQTSCGSSSDLSIIESSPLQNQMAKLSQLLSESKLSMERDSPHELAESCPFLKKSEKVYGYADVEETKMVEPSAENVVKVGTDTTSEAPPEPAKTEKRKLVKRRCRYCQEIFHEEENPRGACEYAPDFMRTTIDEVACIRCARCMLYHCMSDEEGDFAQHPCDCTNEEGCGRRWLGLGLLSIFVPCMWLYPPLRACHWCCVRCGLCGGRHRPAS